MSKSGQEFEKAKSLQEALNLITLDFKTQNSEINEEVTQFYYKINEEFDDKNTLTIENHFENKFKVVITLQSIVNECKTKILWKLINDDEFYTLEFKGDTDCSVTQFCHNFLVEEVKKGENGKNNNCYFL